MAEQQAMPRDLAKKVRLVIFDVDGVLVEQVPEDIRAFGRVPASLRATHDIDVVLYDAKDRVVHVLERTITLPPIGQ